MRERGFKVARLIFLFEDGLRISGIYIRTVELNAVVVVIVEFANFNGLGRWVWLWNASLC